MSLTYHDVLDDAALMAAENAGAFADFLDRETGGGSDREKVDWERRQITFLPRLVKREEVVVPMHLMAMVAGDPAVAVWAWSRPEFADQPIARLSERVRDFGRAQQIAQFADESHPVADDPAEHARALGAAACLVTGMPVAHVVTNGETRMVLVLDPATFVPPVPSRASLAALLESAQQRGLVRDPRRAVQGYAQVRGLPHRWGEGFGTLSLQLSDGEALVRFDDRGGMQLA